MKLYGTPRSGHAHTVRSLLAILGIEHESIDVMTIGGSRTDDFLTINPFGQIPVLDDDGFVVRDSHAILVYLAKKYDESGRWFPNDAKTTARIQEWLATSTLDLVIGPAWARAGTHFRRTIDVPAAQKRAALLLEIIDAHLADREWFAAAHPTVADLAMYSYLRVAPEGGVETSSFENVVAWMRRVEAIDGHPPMHVL